MATYRRIAVRDVTAWDLMSSAEQAVYDAHYTSLQTFSDIEETDLVTGSLGDVVVELFNDGPDGLPTNFMPESSWNTDTNNRMVIRAAPGHETSGIPGSGAKIKLMNSLNIGYRNYRSINVVFENVEFRSDGSSLNQDITSTSSTQFKNCVFYDLYNPPDPGNLTTLFINCIVLPWANANVLQDASLYNCVVFSKADYPRVTRYCDCYNTVVYSTLGKVCFSSCTGDYNASSDASAPGTHSIHNQTLVDLKFIEDSPVDEVSYNFHAADDSSLVDAGTPHDGTFVASASYSADLIGVTRSNGIAWDIGAFEYEVGGIQGTPVDITLRSVAEGSNCIVIKQTDGTVAAGPVLADATGVVTAIFDYLEDTAIEVRVRKSSAGDNPRYLPYKSSGIITAAGFTDFVDQVEDNVAL